VIKGNKRKFKNLNARISEPEVLRINLLVATLEEVMNTNRNPIQAIYFGMEVEILSSMEQHSLIRFEQREFIVETADLTFAGVLARAA